MLRIAKFGARSLPINANGRRFFAKVETCPDALTSGQLAREMKTYSAEFKNASKQGVAMSKEAANEAAACLLKWAKSRGARRFAHVFYPVGRTPGMKMQTFTHLDFSHNDWSEQLKVVSDHFNSTLLLSSETDGSSFPNGGLRETSRAAGFVAWDRTSTSYVQNETLYLPSIFITHNGQAEDEKTPLLRSQKAISVHGAALLKRLGVETDSVLTHVGCEQEFFLVGRDAFLKRPDLVLTGRTLIGRPAPLNQQFSDSYFAQPDRAVEGFFADLQVQATKLGMAFQVGHNEVAPAQHEYAPIFTLTNIAADENSMSMRLMQEIALKHNMVCLFHEKPYAGVNGSGKHNNWSMNTPTGMNLCQPGTDEKSELVFMATVAALTRALHLHGDVIRLGVATPGNDHRLGGHEAPPAIMSLYLGEGLTQYALDAADGGPLTGRSTQPRKVDSGTLAVGPVSTGPEDRNRTAPFPFCGNRFEFRAVGSEQNISWPLTCVHAAVADSMRVLVEKIDELGSVEDAIRGMLNEHRAALFSGDCYSEAWKKEATEVRGLRVLPNSVAAYTILSEQKNIDLFKDTGIFSPEEVQARQNILFEGYVNKIVLEATVMAEMVRTQLLPAGHYHTRVYGREEEKGIYANLENETTALEDLTSKLKKNEGKLGLREQAEFARDSILATMATVRECADQAEGVLPKKEYPFPTYSELTLNHRFFDSGASLRLA